jgi:hypothetical protein
MQSSTLRKIKVDQDWNPHENDEDPRHYLVRYHMVLKKCPPLISQYIFLLSWYCKVYTAVNCRYCTEAGRDIQISIG